MINKDRAYKILFGILAFIIPFILFWITRTNSLGFADAGEFALVTKIGGIAHPPGFPSYVMIGWFWAKIFSLFSIQHITSMILFSICCMCAASLLLFLTLNKITHSVFNSSSLQPDSKNLISLTAALAFCTGQTCWHWANSIEVYAFHVFSMALLLYGLCSYNLERKKSFLIFAAIGLSLGLSNHHLTTIFFIPFILLFFREDLFRFNDITKKKKTKDQVRKLSIVSILKLGEFRFLVILTFIITAFFYTCMFWIAGQDVSFKFGTPDNLSRLIYHISGGAWQKNTAVQVEGIVGMRFPYFMNLTLKQLLLFLPIAIYGLVELFRRKLKWLSIIILLYYILVLIYQLRIDQTSDTDAYMLLPYFILSIPVGVGIYRLCNTFRWIVYLLPFLVVGQATLNYAESDKSNYNVSESLMTQLDKSAPPNSVLLISDWTLVSQYYYYHLAENFRNDLILLNYDIKFTNYEMLKLLYPRLYEYIKPEYDRFIQLLGEAHPQEIYNTGCSLDSPQLLDAFMATFLKIQKYCTEKNVALMSDPRGYLFFKDQHGWSGGAYMSGFFVSSIPTGIGKEFIQLPFKWLDSPQVLSEPAAVDKVVDFEAALDFSRNYYSQTQDTVSYLATEKSYMRIKELQRKMKKNMAFVFRGKGQ